MGMQNRWRLLIELYYSWPAGLEAWPVQDVMQTFKTLPNFFKNKNDLQNMNPANVILQSEHNGR